MDHFSHGPGVMEKISINNQNFGTQWNAINWPHFFSPDLHGHYISMIYIYTLISICLDNLIWDLIKLVLVIRHGDFITESSCQSIPDIGSTVNDDSIKLLRVFYIKACLGSD